MSKTRKRLAARLHARAERLSPESIIGRVELYTAPLAGSYAASNGSNAGPVTITQSGPRR